MAYIPKLHDYGELPSKAGEEQIHTLSEGGIPTTAKEVLVYLWATTKGDEAFHRFYYEISTEDGKQMYNKYMNVAASRDVSLNSANLWLPVFPGFGQIYVKLRDSDPNPKGRPKSIAHRCQKKTGKDGEGKTTFSEFFVLGYRN